MKVLKGGKYICHICQEPFKWNQDSWVFGKIEYKSETERQKNQKLFCSTDCRNKFNPKKSEEK